jgi:hypothetical protein
MDVIDNVVLLSAFMKGHTAKCERPKRSPNIELGAAGGAQVKLETRRVKITRLTRSLISERTCSRGDRMPNEFRHSSSSSKIM